jgi:peptidyl-prolyl cis-trans isomerase C
MISCSKPICDIRKGKSAMEFGKKAGITFLIAALASFAATGAYAMEVAKVNGKPISDGDIRNAIGNLTEGQRESVLRDSASRHQILSGVIDQEVLVQEGEKNKLDQDQEYKDALNTFRRDYLASRVLQKNLASKFTDSSAKKYYESHKDRYSTEQIRAFHILSRDEAEARELKKKVKGMTDDQFQELAEKVSKDPSAKNNRGDLGFFGRDRMVAEFTNPAFEAGEGEIVGPVKTTYGYHIIKVVSKKPGKPLKFEEVEAKVKNDLRTDLTQNYVGNLRKQAKVEVDEKAINKF